MANKTISIQRSYVGPDVDYNQGEVVTIDETLADPMIADGGATLVPEVTGSRANPEQALLSLLTVLQTAGIIKDATSA